MSDLGKSLINGTEEAHSFAKVTLSDSYDLTIKEQIEIGEDFMHEYRKTLEALAQ